MNNVITLTLTDNQINKFVQVYADYLSISNNLYVKYLFKLEGCTVNIYTSNKAVFQGKDAEIYASSFKNKFIDHAGSDEVGTGDFFGPIIIAATILNEDNYNKIKDLGIDDSKKIDDAKILRIAPKLIEKLPHTVLILDNAKYNEVINDNNMNKIKARMHNQAYINLMNKGYTLPNKIIIDQFASPKNYFNYLKDEHKIIRNIIFETKAESKYQAVAAASIIARYTFLKYLEKMNQDYKFDFKKGAGAIVDETIKRFINKYSADELKKVAKLNFKNYTKIKKI